MDGGDLWGHREPLPLLHTFPAVAGPGMAPALGPTSWSSRSHLGRAPHLTQSIVGEMAPMPTSPSGFGVLAFFSHSEAVTFAKRPVGPGTSQWQVILSPLERNEGALPRRTRPRPRSHSSQVDAWGSDSRDLTSHYPSPGWHGFILGKTQLVSTVLGSNLDSSRFIRLHK